MIKPRFFWIIVTGLIMAIALVVVVQMSDVLELLDTGDSVTAVPIADVTAEPDSLPVSILPTVFTFIDEFDQNGQKKLRLSGTGEPNTVILILDAGQRTRQIRSDNDGDWSVILDANDERPMVLEAVSFNERGITVRGDETVYRIAMPRAELIEPSISLEDGIIIEDDVFSPEGVVQAETILRPQPTLIMVTAPGGPSRVVKSPFGGMPTNGPLTMGPIDYDETGGVIFSGITSEEGRVRLYANDSAIGETRVGVGGRWNFIAGRMLPEGDYTVRAELIRNNGERVQVSVPFSFKKDATAVVGPMPFVKFEPLRWQIKRELLGGGVQSTAIFAPAGTEPLMPAE